MSPGDLLLTNQEAPVTQCLSITFQLIYSNHCLSHRQKSPVLRLSSGAGHVTEARCSLGRLHMHSSFADPDLWREESAGEVKEAMWSRSTWQWTPPGRAERESGGRSWWGGGAVILPDHRNPRVPRVRPSPWTWHVTEPVCLFLCLRLLELGFCYIQPWVHVISLIRYILVEQHRDGRKEGRQGGRQAGEGDGSASPVRIPRDCLGTLLFITICTSDSMFFHKGWFFSCPEADGLSFPKS